MNEISIGEAIFLIFALVFGVTIIIILIKGSRKSSDYGPFGWDGIIAFAAKNNASNLLIEIGRSPQMKIHNKWSTIINVSVIEEKEFSELKLILASQPQPDVWIISRSARAHVVRHEDNAIELELKHER